MLDLKGPFLPIEASQQHTIELSSPITISIGSSVVQDAGKVPSMVFQNGSFRVNASKPLTTLLLLITTTET